MKNKYFIDERIRGICKNEYKFFFCKPNVVGVGLGYKITNGFCTNQKCITIFVRKKLPLNELCTTDIIPTIYRGIPTNVIESGIIKTCSLRKKLRPVLGGYSIGVDGIEDGSMGCLVADSNHDYILTCNHVVARNTSKSKNKVVIQPAPKYGGKSPRDVVGAVSEFVKVNVSSDENFEDVAIVQTDRSKASIALAFLGPLKGSTGVSLGEIVEKVGATTELTTGVVEDLSATLKINFLGREVTFKDQVVTTKMSSSGDSGSVLVNSKKQAVGLLMGDSDTISIFNDMNSVLESLEVHILRH